MCISVYYNIVYNTKIGVIITEKNRIMPNHKFHIFLSFFIY
jgi:hypothetical protein